MRTSVLLASLGIVIGALVLALLYFSDESQVKRQFNKQYPSYSIDHISEDGMNPALITSFAIESRTATYSNRHFAEAQGI